MIHLEHSPLGGSAAHRFMNCTGSFLLHRHQLETGTFENVESEYAKLGTAAHEICARAVSEAIEPYEFLGEEVDGYLVGWPGGIDLDAVQAYFNECMSILDARKEQGYLLIEETIKLPELHPLLRGTVDFGFWSLTDGVFLRDYKNGEGIGVAAAGNAQLLYYAFLMIMADHRLRGAPRDLPVNLGIVQPNFYGVFEGPDVWVTDLGYVLDWGHEQLLPRMEELYIPNERPITLDMLTGDDFMPGEHCQFCPVLLDCPKMQRAFEEYAAADEEFIAMLSNEELDRYYAMREQARRFMNALETTVHARLVGGATITSAKLVEKRTNRVWKPGAQAALIAAFGDKAYEPKKVKSPAAVEKMSTLGKELALEYGYKPDANGLSVAPLSDPRPEAKPKGNATVFENFAQSPEQMGF